MKNEFKLKNIVKKEYFRKEIILSLVTVMMLLGFVVYESLAIFASSVSKNSIARLTAGTINLSITSDDSSYNNSTKQITVAAKATKAITIYVENTTPTDIKYQMYYKIVSTNYGGLSIGVSNKSAHTASETLYSSTGSNTKKVAVRVLIINNNDYPETIEIGADGGYNYGGTIVMGNEHTIMSTITEPYIDESGANKPELVQGMVPVIYNESSDVWQVADTSTKWYSYGEQMWANAVTVNNATYRSAGAGTQIPMSAIDTMWVWIPRYSYKIPSNIGSSSNVTSPPQIDVIFASGVATSEVNELTSCPITATNCYYTHPAFKNGSYDYNYISTPYDSGGWDHELTGIWVGKFETGGTASKPLIKPDIQSLRSQTVSTQFQTSLVFAGGTMNTSTGEVSYSTNQYGLTRNTTTDSHMMKNTEWGAVAYLSQSKYGKNGNSNYSGTNKEIYINNSSSYYTGRSYGATNTSPVLTTYGTYGYNNKSCSSTSSGVCTGSKTSYKGTGASTTGTIYGIYDMSGGAFEYTMSNWAGYSGYSSSSNSGFSGPNYTGTITSGISFPSAKYYDKYTGTSSTTATSSNSIKGDATYETARWYSDSAYFVNSSSPWALRGGYYSSKADAGVFYFGNNYGVSGTGIGFRSALIP